MKCRRVEPDRVRKVIGTSNLGYEALPRGVVKRGAKAEQKGDHIDVLGRRVAGHRQQAECGSAERKPRLSHLENLLLVESVCDEAAVRGKQQHRQELQARCDADREARTARKLEYQPVLRDALHPGTDIGDERPCQVPAVVGLDQRPEHATSWMPHRWCSRGDAIRLRAGLGVDAHPWFSFSKTPTARRKTSRSAGSNPSIRTASHWSRRRRFASST